MRQGSTVTVLVSTGVPEPTLAPSLVGLPLDQVSGKIQEFRDATELDIGWSVEHT